MRPRVCYVFDSLSDVRFVDGFAEMFDLTVVYPRGSGGFTNEPKGAFVKVVLPGGRVGFPYRVARWLAANKNSYDVVFVLGDTTAALGANLAGLVTSKPVVQIEGKQTEEYFRAKAGSMNPVRFWASLALLRVILWANGRMATAGAGACDAIVDVSATRSKRMIPWYGIDVEVFAPGITKQEAREMLGLPVSKSILLYRSRIAPEKDPETFLAACQTLHKAGRDVVVLYVGGEYEQFQQIASAFDVEVVARGHVHPLDELPVFYAASDVAVQTSKAEGLALSTLEALASEVPVVASATGGMLETIRPGETGLSARVADAQDVAEKIAWMLDHPAEAKEMARRGRQMVVSTYSSEVAMKGWMKIAMDVIRR